MQGLILDIGYVGVPTSTGGRAGKPGRVVVPVAALATLPGWLYPPADVHRWQVETSGVSWSTWLSVCSRPQSNSRVSSDKDSSA